MSSRFLIRGAVLWSEAGPVHDQDLLIGEGHILRVGRGLRDTAARVIRADGWLVLPGLIDLHAHLGEPGREDRETLESGLRAAAWGGFTAVLAMPDTDPPIDRESDVQYLRARSERSQGARALVCCALTKGRQGEELAELAAMRAAGAVAAGDAKPVGDARIVRRALEYAGMVQLPVLTDARDANLAKGGVAHEGEVGAWLGLAGVPAAAEWVALARDLLLAESTMGRLHVQGVSTRRSVELIRDAKAHGVRVTAECGFHHLFLTDEALSGYETSTKLMPPLRSSDDVRALVEGVREGIIDCVVSDHTPLTREEKDVEFDYAEFGAAGLEAVLPALHTHLIHTGELSWNEIVAALSRRPRSVLGLPQPTFDEGDPCEITLFNPEARDTIAPERWQSSARNTPLAGDTVVGRVEGVYVDGRACGRWVEEDE